MHYPDDNYLTVAEAADRLACSKRTIYRYLEDGRLDAVQLGPQRTYVPASSIAHFLATLNA